MAVVHLTINGRKVGAPVGSTLLKTAQAAGIDIPTLCNHPALPATGSCRICVVEIEGQRTLQTACTFPVADGMVVQTESPRVVAARKLVLDMLFSERNHFCMYCEASGACELQALGYRYGIDHWIYPTYTQPYSVDASHKLLLMEQNRCILCARCVRACGDLVANHTLGQRGRGTETRIHADAGLPWGQSSCISCGTCTQVCPTGTLTVKRSAYAGHGSQTERIASTCSRCSIGCGIVAVTRGGRIVKIEGNWDSEINGGLLCRIGRFDPLMETRKRMTVPLMRRKDRLEPATWQEAVEILAGRIRATAPDKLGVLSSSHATNEALYLLDTLFRVKIKAARIGLMGRMTPQPLKGPSGALEDISRSDLIVMVGADPVNEQPVGAFAVKRAMDKGTRLLLVGDKENALSATAFQTFTRAEISRAVEIAGRAEYPLVICGSDLDKPLIAALAPLQAKAAFIPLQPGINTAAAAAMGFRTDTDPSGLETLLILQGEAAGLQDNLLDRIEPTTFTAVLTCFDSPLAARADLILPVATWWETSGSLTNTAGCLRPLQRVLAPTGEARSDWEALALLSDRMGYPMDVSPEALWACAGKAIVERRTRHAKG